MEKPEEQEETGGDLEELLKELFADAEVEPQTNRTRRARKRCWSEPRISRASTG